MEFVGVELTPNGNTPARSNLLAFEKLLPPETWADLSILIGMFGFKIRPLPDANFRLNNPSQDNSW